MSLDIASLWDFSDPAGTEQKFLALLPDSTPEETLILKTQIARTHGLRKDFAQASAILDEIEPKLADAGPEATVRYELERGRTLASATHQGPANQEAGKCYLRAYDIAKAARLDSLAVDALHMMAFVEQAPADQLKWGREALEIALASEQPAAHAWEGSLRNNIGYALMELGHHEDALKEFELCRQIREREGKPDGVRISRFMSAKCMRLMGRLDDAEATQLGMKQELADLGRPTPYQDEELAEIAQARKSPGQS